MNFCWNISSWVHDHGRKFHTSFGQKWGWGYDVSAPATQNMKRFSRGRAAETKPILVGGDEATQTNQKKGGRKDCELRTIILLCSVTLIPYVRNVHYLYTWCNNRRAKNCVGQPTILFTRVRITYTMRLMRRIIFGVYTFNEYIAARTYGRVVVSILFVNKIRISPTNHLFSFVKLRKYARLHYLLVRASVFQKKKNQTEISVSPSEDPPPI